MIFLGEPAALEGGSALPCPSGDSNGSATILWSLWGFAGLLTRGCDSQWSCSSSAWIEGVRSGREHSARCQLSTSHINH